MILCSRLYFVILFFQQDQGNTTTSGLKPDENLLVNGKDLINDQPVKISRIELIENKLNANPLPESKFTSQQIQLDNPKATSKEKENCEGDQSSIVTADYIQQSKKYLNENTHAEEKKN